VSPFSRTWVNFGNFLFSCGTHRTRPDKLNTETSGRALFLSGKRELFCTVYVSSPPALQNIRWYLHDHLQVKSSVPSYFFFYGLWSRELKCYVICSRLLSWRAMRKGLYALFFRLFFMLFLTSLFFDFWDLSERSRDRHWWLTETKERFAKRESLSFLGLYRWRHRLKP
jgi:hypothetical protein